MFQLTSHDGRIWENKVSIYNLEQVAQSQIWPAFRQLLEARTQEQSLIAIFPGFEGNLKGKLNLEYKQDSSFSLFVLWMYSVMWFCNINAAIDNLARLSYIMTQSLFCSQTCAYPACCSFYAGPRLRPHKKRSRNDDCLTSHTQFTQISLATLEHGCCSRLWLHLMLLNGIIFGGCDKNCSMLGHVACKIYSWDQGTSLHTSLLPS